jgi:hypothetical protein
VQFSSRWHLFRECYSVVCIREELVEKCPCGRWVSSLQAEGGRGFGWVDVSEQLTDNDKTDDGIGAKLVRVS